MNPLVEKVADLIPDKVRASIKKRTQDSLFSALSKVSGGRHKALLWTYSNFEMNAYSILLRGYFQGLIPLPNMSNGQFVEWHDPEYRGIVPIEDFRARGDLMRVLKKNQSLTDEKRFIVKINTDFKKTIESCAKPRKRTKRTWLTPAFIEAAMQLHDMGIAHSIETYQNGELVGGVIGFAINGYFGDITLFHFVDNASKVAYYHLLLKLKESGFTLHDSGWGNTWFSQFNLINMHREEFKRNLTQAMITHVKMNDVVPKLYF
ncbi:leucyl/phenylalanyl-tRNA--protein transferase [Desertivirga arenae]|uniref:leucyl/phenylalanyl-tRNA--protein transferase n=1 Tax=Desertivirga arenae TaxID=2810309 RepID=UPI001A95FE27|nr:leucyl/phenylalanyl-tRNA--protein transferase [Pedobacter sp. SYSU D00823]